VNGGLFTLVVLLTGWAWWRVMQARDHNLGLQDGWVDDLAHTITDEAVLQAAYDRGDFPAWQREAGWER
jgi:hypothetical protein